jgi:hypothetical protein
MSAHLHATATSRDICDRLVQRLQGVIPTNTSVVQRERICGVGTDPRFANIVHASDGLTVYLKCDKSDEAALRGLLGINGPLMTERGAQPGSWEKDYAFRVEITSNQDIEKALPVLDYVAKKNNLASV